uniref:Uncharacterized protein n=1 Tax=Eutreptiella gymnastica TaxID=73025 RepID=A0A7S4FQ91_9EUGL
MASCQNPLQRLKVREPQGAGAHFGGGPVDRPPLRSAPIPARGMCRARSEGQRMTSPGAEQRSGPAKHTALVSFWGRGRGCTDCCVHARRGGHPSRITEHGRPLVGGLRCVTCAKQPLDMEDVWPKCSTTGDQDGNPDRGRLTVETASKGLGLAGRVQVPQEMWDRLRPCSWAEAHQGAAEQRASRGVESIRTDHRSLESIPAPTPVPSNLLDLAWDQVSESSNTSLLLLQVNIV